LCTSDLNVYSFGAFEKLTLAWVKQFLYNTI